MCKALKESSFTTIFISNQTQNEQSLSIGDTQKVFNILVKLLNNEGTMNVQIENIRERGDMLKKVAKFSGLELFESSESSPSLLCFKKKVYVKQAKVITNSNGVVKENPFAKAKLEQTTNANNNKIDEDALLNSDKVEDKLQSDCSTKPRACKNCSCGRKDMEDEMDQEDMEKIISTGQVKSECGSCFLGDAFRCTTCPYRGLPAFQSGDKIKLDLDGDSIGNELKDESTKVVGGKIKIEL